MPRGAAGAVRDAALTTNAKVFVVADGTAIPGVDLTHLLAEHASSGAVVTVVSHVEHRRHAKGSLQVPTGIYVFNREMLETVPDRGFCDIKETLIPQLHKANVPVRSYTVDNPSPRVLDASSYRAVNEWMVEQLISSRTVPEGYVLSGTTLIHREAIVSRDATFVGPVLIGPGAEIGAGAVIVGPTSIGREAKIGRDVLVSRSAIWRHAILHEQVVADRCILADGSVVSSASHVFGEVMTMSHGELEVVQRSAGAVRESASFELLRRMSRVVFPNAVWSRYPAAQ